MTLDSLVADAIEELRAWYRDHPDERDANDAIAKIVESAVPVNADDLLLLAAENPQLAVDVPEFRPVSDGSPTPVIIAANICEIMDYKLCGRHGMDCFMERRPKVTQHDVTTARARLFYWLELNGHAGNPVATIRRIAHDLAPGRRGVRDQLEDFLLSEWAQFSATEGDD